MVFEPWKTPRESRKQTQGGSGGWENYKYNLENQNSPTSSRQSTAERRKHLGQLDMSAQQVALLYD